MLSAQIAEIAILQLIVLISIHIGKDLQDTVTLKTQLHLVDDVCKIGESDVAARPQVESSERRGNFAELVDDFLG